MNAQSGFARAIRPRQADRAGSGDTRRIVNLNTGEWQHSFATDLAWDRTRKLLCSRPGEFPGRRCGRATRTGDWIRCRRSNAFLDCSLTRWFEGVCRECRRVSVCAVAGRFHCGSVAHRASLPRFRLSVCGKSGWRQAKHKSRGDRCSSTRGPERPGIEFHLDYRRERRGQTKSGRLDPYRASVWPDYVRRQRTGGSARDGGSGFRVKRA